MELVRQKNAATVIVFPLTDEAGDLVSGASGLDSEIDAFADGTNPNGFADCTNEATEIGSTGIYYLALTQAEMNQDYVTVQVKSSSAKTQVILIRTTVGDPLNAATTDDGGAINVASGVVEAQVKSIDSGAITASSIASNAITAAKIASDAITAAKVAADVTTEIQSGLATSSALATVSGKIDAIDDFLDTEVAAILADTGELQADWADGGRLDLLIDAIKAKTDSLPSDPADASVVAGLISGIDAKIDALDGVADGIQADLSNGTDGAVGDGLGSSSRSPSGG